MIEYSLVNSLINILPRSEIVQILMRNYSISHHAAKIATKRWRYIIRNRKSFASVRSWFGQLAPGIYAKHACVVYRVDCWVCSCNRHVTSIFISKITLRNLFLNKNDVENPLSYSTIHIYNGFIYLRPIVTIHQVIMLAI